MKKKVKVINGFALPMQGYYREGTEVTLYFGREQTVGVLTLERYEELLKQGSIGEIREVKHGKVQS